MLSLKVKKVIMELPPTEIARQIKYGTSVGLTRLAQAGQKTVTNALTSTFTIRTGWLRQNSPIGIKIKSASKNEETPYSEVYTGADFLALHETGGIKTPHGKMLAIPTVNVRRTKRQLIRKMDRPGNLKKAFFLKTKKENLVLMMQRSGRKKKSFLKAMYVMKPAVDIDKQSTFYEPLEKLVKTRSHEILLKEIEKAFKSAVNKGAK